MDPVDLALVIALDGSASVTFDEFGLMAGGLGAALRDPTVMAGLIGGPRRASLGALLLWSGSGAQEVMIGWTRLATPEDVAGFADQVENVPRAVKAGATAIGEALIGCARLLAETPATSRRQIVDVAGDGQSNDGVPPGPVRDRMVTAGITINGLCVLHEEPDLLETYTREVIGGPGAFALTCADYAGFAEGMRRKLLREVGTAPVS
jgi:Ca-activated chloride channel homolog